MEENKEKDKERKDEGDQLCECQKQRDEYLAGWQRARADFLNYKKEEIERFEGVIKYANEELILKFLPILDNMELAENKLTDDLKCEEYIKGVLQIKKQLADFLKEQGIEEIETIGKKFDPNLHEAVGQKEGEGESGQIVEVVQKGYKLNGKIIRAVKVRIAK